MPLQRLQTLCVEDNELTSWEALAPLAALPHLEFLNLNGNAIASVPKVDGFTALKVTPPTPPPIRCPPPPPRPPPAPPPRILASISL